MNRAMSDRNMPRVQLRLAGASKKFYKGGCEISVLDDVDLTLHQGETVSIVGASGVGKSTLLHILGTLDRPSTGTLYYNDLDVFSLPPQELAGLRNATVGFVFQFHHLLPEFDALENVMMPSIIAGKDMAMASKKAEDALELVGMAHRKHHRPGELSGGEQQRVVIARSISQNPRVLLADEPTGNLDHKTGDGIHQLMMRLNEELGLTLVVVTHNRELAGTMSRQLMMRDGKLIDVAGGP